MITTVAIVGPTASGKSRLGMELALRAGGEIISIDSRQAYRHLDIGTAKPSASERRDVAHHLIDILELEETNNAERFAAMAREAARGIAARGRLPIFVGGSGLYFRAIRQGFFSITLDPAERIAFARSLRGTPDAELHARLESLDAESARRIHPNDRYRVVRALEVHALTGTPLSVHMKRGRPDPSRDEIRYVTVGLRVPRPALRRAIHERTSAMFERGWVDETRRLLDGGADPEWPGMKTLGYPQVIAFIRGERTLEETSARIVELTRQYAKRQITWFKREPGVAWFRADAPDLIDSVLALVRERPDG